MSVMTRIAMDWARRCFGFEHVSNPRIRGLRMVEEAIECCQALGVAKDKVLLTVENVYSRPVGDVAQEIGGVLMTVAVLCESLGMEQDGLMERELTRVLAKSPEHFAKRNQEKLDLGLDAKVDTRSMKWTCALGDERCEIRDNGSCTKQDCRGAPTSC